LRASGTGLFIPDQQHRYPLNVRLGGFQSPSGRYGEENSPCLCRELNSDSYPVAQPDAYAE